MPRLHRLLREPMLHFLVLGLGLFLLYGWLGGESAGQGERIEITRGRVEQIVAAYERANQRAPLPAELDGLIEDAVREEVLYREAMAMGLDRDDTIVRRRLRQKLEFVSEGLEPVPEPSDARLAAYLQAHAQAYATQASYTLALVYLDPQKHGARLADDASKLLSSLRRKGDVEGRGAGDAFLLPERYEETGADELSRTFGEAFTARLRTLPLGEWQGPIESGLGFHLVYVHERQAPRVPALAEIRAAVRTDYLDDQRRQASERYYASLRARYEVSVDREGVALPERVAALAGGAR